MDKITKLPWKVHLNSYWHWHEISSNDQPVAQTKNQEDAEYICLAVNSHEGLVEALKKSHACATVKDDGSCEGCFVSKALKAAQEETV